MRQRTLKNTYRFEGKGLHSGRLAHICLKPAPADSGVVFVRTDKSQTVRALVDNVSLTSRSTTISENGVSVTTIEHLMSALYGLGIDNAIVETDEAELPILDGSARPYVEAICADGLVEQDAERKYIEFDSVVEYRDEKSGSWIKVTPSDEPSFDVTIDFNSRVLGVQTVHWDLSTDYSTQIAPCRTFVFLHEIKILATLGLVKGGDVENAIVIVEKPVSDRVLSRMAKTFGQPKLSVTPEGYLSNLTLRFPDECGRHKLLDVMGDLSLVGGYMKARVEAYKPGHSINTNAAKLIREKTR